MSYTPPNYTQIPNALLDEHLSQMKEAELKVTLAIARKTFGWHKQADKISLSQLMEMTGMSRQGVINGIEDGMKRGTIEREATGQAFTYHLVVNPSTDECSSQPSRPVETPTSQPSRPVLVNEVDQLAPKLVNEVDTQKKELLKETIKEKRSLADADGGEDVKVVKTLSNTLQGVGVGLTQFMIDQYIDLVKDYGLPAVVSGIQTAAQNGKQHRYKYVAACIANVAQGHRAPPPAAKPQPQKVTIYNQYTGQHEERVIT